MKKSAFPLFNMCFIAALFASASSFQGYDRKSTGKTLKLIENLERVIETPKDILLLSNDSAFYRFPKSRAPKDFSDFLEARMKQKKKVSIEVDPVTTEIVNIGDVKSAP